MLTKKCKEEIKSYIFSQGWFNYGHYLFTGLHKSDINMEYFIDSPKGQRKMMIRYDKDNIILILYLLEYIGHILRKYNIKEIMVQHSIYRSINWKFDDIKKIKGLNNN